MAEATKLSALKMVYFFGNGRADGSAHMNALLGGKGAHLAEMANLGLPVPPGFTITAEVCNAYQNKDREVLARLKAEVDHALAHLGERVGASFADPKLPLLVSVRSGARVSMPGMMDTVLNLGLNDETVQGLATRFGNPRFAHDCYRRFIQMYASTVLQVSHDVFEDLLDGYKSEIGIFDDAELTADDLKEIVQLFKEGVERESGQPLPQDTNLQIWGAIKAVFSSWQNARAKAYRSLHNIPDNWGTAVTVQAMAFGNIGQTSATGIAFTRNPSTGNKEVYGEYLANAQGEDIVAGIRTPYPLTEATRHNKGDKSVSLEALMPQAYKQLADTLQILEQHYRDIQDVEFTIQDGQLWILQTRPGKCTASAAVKIAVDMAREGMLTPAEAVTRVRPEQLSQLIRPSIDTSSIKHVVASGLPASPGAASGEIVFSADDAHALKAQGRNVIMVRVDTSPEDIHGMHVANGILTSRGGMTSHAAVIARGIGCPCVSGARVLQIDYAAQTMTVMGHIFRAGDSITIDGSTGKVFKGVVPMRQPELSADVAVMIEWAQKTSGMHALQTCTEPTGEMQQMRHAVCP